MIKSFTPSFLIRTLGGIASSLFSLTAGAQTAPAWSSVRAIGPTATYGAVATVDAFGNTYETGNFDGTTTIAGTTLTSAGNTDGYLAKYTPAGALAWVRQVGSPGSDYVSDVAVDAAGNAYVTGDFSGSMALGNNVSLVGGNVTVSKVMVVRYSPQGTPEWAQQSRSTPPNNTAVGGGIKIDAAGTVYLTGYFNNPFTIESTTINVPNLAGVFLARLSAATGALQSLLPAFQYAPFTSSVGVSYTYPKLAISPTGDTYILNTFTQSPIFGTTTLTSRGKGDVLVAKYSAQGTFEWVQQFGGVDEDLVNQGVVDATGNLYVTASFTGSATFGSTTLAGAGNLDGSLVKYSPQGALQWVQSVGGPASDNLFSVSLDAAGNPYVAGYFAEVARLGSGTLTSAGRQDIVAAAYTPQGQVRWVQQAGGPGLDYGLHLGFDARDNAYLVGRFANTCSFGSLTLSTTATQETFLAHLGNTVLATQQGRPVAQALPVYPNPASDAVQVADVLVGRSVQLLDAAGRAARTEMVAPNATISVRGLPAGRYTLRATTADGSPYTGHLLVL
ncbi:hypothetical protein GCM10011375_40910 [Hymenobacter qilianensis]|uniref:Uncharacterized protein n=2 Tax=Hymenobacter qilianensis TaxID=1385715 RepID=A0ACB5PXE9_9BACT|nr:SBBP repeat-containing protein [Hymenobacter qilianensis]QNP54521.1 SBBP repeat-containing protein [Hymenobacter qilianensis]GGF81790.1 hypothetical protein GCM10011375_40910 [Hymenobacter qilianensis]